MSGEKKSESELELLKIIIRHFLFAFDRDETLVPGVGHKMREDEFLFKEYISIFKKICWAKLPYAIVSTGATDPASCNAHKAVRNAVGEEKFKNHPPANEAISKGMEGVLNAIPIIQDTSIGSEEGTSINGKSLSLADKLKKQLQTIGIRIKGRQIDKLTEEEISGYIGAVQFGKYFYDEETEEHYKGVVIGKEIYYIEIDPNATFEIKFGESTITINTLNWLKSTKLHNDGDNKFFQLLKSQDKLKQRLKITDEVRNLGVIAIESPPDYVEVDPKDITMSDDKEGVCDLMRAAGVFTLCAKDKNYIKNLTARFKVVFDEFLRQNYGTALFNYKKISNNALDVEYAKQIKKLNSTGFTIFMKKDERLDAVKILKKLAELGHFNSLYFLAQALYKGKDGFPKNLNSAYYLLLISYMHANTEKRREGIQEKLKEWFQGKSQKEIDEYQDPNPGVMLLGQTPLMLWGKEKPVYERHEKTKDQYQLLKSLRESLYPKANVSTKLTNKR